MQLLLLSPPSSSGPRLALPPPDPHLPSLDTQQEGWLESGWGTVSPSKLENGGKEDLWWPGEWCVCVRVCIHVYTVCSVKASAATKSFPSHRREFQDTLEECQLHAGHWDWYWGP